MIISKIQILSYLYTADNYFNIANAKQMNSAPPVKSLKTGAGVLSCSELCYAVTTKKTIKVHQSIY